MKGFIFDLDGTVYLGSQIIDGAPESIEALRARGDKVVFLTNKSIANREEYVEKLNYLGVKANAEEVISSNFITAKYLKEHLSKDESVIVVGEKPLLDELELNEIKVTNDPRVAKYVVLGWDREFSYEKLNLAFQATRNGAKVIATNPDRTCPLENDEEIPDCGAMIGALEGATGRPIDLVIGKPSNYLANTVVKDILKMDFSQCYMVGDRLETDIRMGNESGMNSVLVLTGISNREMVDESDHKPTYMLESIKEIVNI